MISVILPTYNRAQTLARAIASVRAQTHTEWELIVVDDGSEDGTKSCVASFHDSRIRYIYQSNQGVAAARNTGIAHAQGAYLALLDSDDEWHRSKLQAQLEFSHAGGWEISQSEEVWVRYGRPVNPGWKHAKRSGWIFAPSLHLCLVSPSCVLMSRRCWERIGPFDASLLACEDYDLWLRCSLQYPVGLLPRKLVTRYAGHPDQLSRKMIGLDLYRIASLCNLLGSPELKLEYRILAQEVLATKLRRYVQGCLKRGKEEEALRVLEKVKQVMGPESWKVEA